MYSRTLSEQLKERERRELEPTREIVGDTFRHEEGSLPQSIVAPRGMGLARKALSAVLILAILFFIGAIGFFIYYFGFGGGTLSSSAQNIDIAVAGPPEVQGGNVTQLQVIVTNHNNAPLQLSELVLTYPPGTRSVTTQVIHDNCSIPSVDPATGEMKSQRICLGTINPGESRQGEIPVIFSGTAGEQENVKLELEYHLAGSNAIFVASNDYGITFGSSPLSISVDGNSETISGQPVQFTVSVTSNATAPVRDALISVSYPFGFKFTSATPAPAVNSGVAGLWALGDMNPGDTRSVTVQGVLSGDPGDQRTFQVQSGTRDTSTSTSITTALASEPFSMNISQSFLGLSLTVNGASTTTTVSPGDPITVAVNYQNNLPTAIDNAIIVARLSGAEIDGSTVRSQNGFYRSSDDSMYWDKTTTSGSLASIPPGAKGSLQFTFQAPTTGMLKGASAPRIVMSVSAAGERTDQSGVPQTLQSVTSQTIGIASDLEFAAQGLYYANPFGSTGPIPPKANVETTYAIVFTITNTTNQITNAKLTAHLPPYVRWLGSYSPASEKISFNDSDGTLTWDLGTIAPGAGENGAPPRQAAIAIGFTPSTSQIGSQPALMQQIAFTGLDATSSKQLNKSVEDVTTNLSQVRKSSDGMVIRTDPGFNPQNATVVK